LQDSRFPVNYEDIKSLLYYCKWHWREYSDHPLETKYVPNYEETIQLMISHLPTLDGLDQLLDTFKEEYNMRPLCEVLRAHSQ